MKDTLVFLQCCKRKTNREQYFGNTYDLAAHLPKTYDILCKSVQYFTAKGVINPESTPVTALSLYDGHFYNTPGLRATVAKEILHGSYEFLILSAGYGVVHPFQRIHAYEQEMKGRITAYWQAMGLPTVLQEFLETGGYRRVYGVFSQSADYRKIVEHIDWISLKHLQEAKFFYVDGVRGASQVLRLSGALLLKLLENDFKTIPASIGGATVKFEQMR